MSVRAALHPPRPGTAFGLYPQRDAAASQRPALARWRDRIAGARVYRQIAEGAAEAAERWHLLPDHKRRIETGELRARLSRAGLEARYISVAAVVFATSVTRR